jgi:hypothetical protein
MVTQSPHNRGSTASDLGYRELEQILTDLLIVKYPGIEQADVKELFHALETGDMERVERAEANLALKSARWIQAALDLAG